MFFFAIETKLFFNVTFTKQPTTILVCLQTYNYSIHYVCKIYIIILDQKVFKF